MKKLNYLKTFVKKKKVMFVIFWSWEQFSGLAKKCLFTMCLVEHDQIII